VAKGEIGDTLQGTTASLLNVLRSSNELVPGVVLVGGALGVAVIYVCAHFGGPMIGVTALTVFAVSVAIYGRKGDFGDAALGLAAGIFAAFAVNWDVSKFFVFEFLWLAFGLYVLLATSIRLAGRAEVIYVHAAQAMGSDDVDGVGRRLRAIGRDSAVPSLGPIERAEVLRYFAFRRMPLEAMMENLKSVAMLAAITGVDHTRMASYVSDMWTMLGQRQASNNDAVRDRMFVAIRDSSTSPEEFLSAFHHSRRLVLAEGVNAEFYLRALIQATTGGVPGSEMYDHLKQMPATTAAGGT